MNIDIPATGIDIALYQSALILDCCADRGSP